MKTPNWVVFSEFKGYDAWPDVAVSPSETRSKVILEVPDTLESVSFIEKDTKTIPAGNRTVRRTVSEGGTAGALQP